MNNEAIKKLYEALAGDYDLGTIEDFTAYLMDDEKRKKAVGNGNRIITMHATPASITKNRYGITDNIDFAIGTNPLAPYIDSLKEA